MLRGLKSAGLIAVAVLAMTAGSANALTSYQAEMANTNGGFQKGRAECGAGERVVSGGFSGPIDSTALISKASGESAWIVKGYFDLPASVSVDCSSTIGVDVAKDTKRFSGRDVLKVSARCRPNWDAVAGGWAYDKVVSNTPVFTSAPHGSRWVVGGFDGNGEPKALTSYAYCARGDIEVDRTSTPMPASDDTTGLAGCDLGQQLLGGGFETSPKPDFDNATGPDPFFYTSRRTNEREWSASANNYSAMAGTLDTFATCRD